MKFKLQDILAKLAQGDLVSLVKSFTSRVDLTLRVATLPPNKSSKGFVHRGQETTYIFVSGTGTMEMDSKVFGVVPGDVVLLHDGVYNKVHNPSDNNELLYICVTETNRVN